jgi:hypothetical protein
MSYHCNLPEHIFSMYFTNPISIRAVEWFCQKSLGTILVGKDKLKVPWDPVQLMFRSKFWQLCTEDGETPDWILKEFEIQSNDSEFWVGWFIANGILDLPKEDVMFKNIYCDNLMIQGYKPEQERKIPTIIPFSSKAFREGLASFQRQFELTKKARQALAEEEDASQFLQVLKIFEKLLVNSPSQNEYIVTWRGMDDHLKYNLERSGFYVNIDRNQISLTMPKTYIRYNC